MVPLTVALLTYNRAHYLRQSLQAIVDQTWGDFELLVLDNGSTDETPQVVLSFNDPRLRYVRNPPGSTARFNNMSALWLFRGERLLITHDDDIMEPDMLKRQMALIAAHPELTAVWTNKSIIDKHGKQVQAWFSAPGPDRIFARGEFIARAAVENLWHPPSSLIFSPRLQSLKKLQQAYLAATPPRHRGNGDLVVPATMNLHGPVGFVNAPLLRYRQHDVQQTQQVHLARAALYSSTMLSRLIKKTDYCDEFLPIFDARIARFKAQDLLLDVSARQIPASILARMQRLLDKAPLRLSYSPLALSPLLPLILLLAQLGRADAATDALADNPLATAGIPGPANRLQQWIALARSERNIFTGYAPGTNVVILGSVMLAAILIQEARKADLNVVCCLDSNVTRQGIQWLGVPIVAHDWLQTATGIDLIVLSAERDHEQELIEGMHQLSPATPVVSWKQLLDAAA